MQTGICRAMSGRDIERRCLLASELPSDTSARGRLLLVRIRCPVGGHSLKALDQTSGERSYVPPGASDDEKPRVRWVDWMLNSDLRSLRYAVTVAEHLSFRRAANAVGIRQSALSRQIRRLEETIGISLFERHSGGLRPTHAGRAFVQDARYILMLLDRALDRADRDGRAETGVLTLGFFPSVVSGKLKDVLHRFRSRSPDVLLETMEGSPVDQLVWLRARRIDAGILAGGYEAPDLECLPLWEERIFVAIPQDHRLAEASTVEWRDLRRERWLVRTFESGAVVYNFLIGRLARDGHFPATSMHLTSRENILGLVGAGYGVTIVPETLTGMPYPGIVFRPIEDEGALLPISAAWVARNENPALSRFIRLLRQIRSESRL